MSSKVHIPAILLCGGGQIRHSRDARDRKIVEQSLRDMSTAALSADISNDFSDAHHSVIWSGLGVPSSVTDIISSQPCTACNLSI